ncbi:glucose-6-phosphate dehydrogenase (coenzyme-F420) [Kineosporia succinea]|uniref:F420-dependent glucose-6-phosphate dehydrogenase n=1 Tax=Kineosporia succinea TaxID=84632 RepID=A0ABT9NVT0_9ACTN|nr:glucose-6-phosphate dehydrogenase (coenzyme-F420) [Kineosporia succinea]MDP9824431.1 coenzyme F420-dependent glucose-6-phosphate dehydrogenase [Kineosporia succinea]
MTLKLGYKASAEQFAPGQLADFAVQAEDQGLDSVWISDHFQPWRHVDGHAPSALVWLPWVAARTSRVQLGTSVLTPTLRYNPAVIAQAFATLGCLAPGRVILGIGTGEALNETAVGVEFPEPRTRFARLREAVRLIRQLWTDERVTFEGEFYRLHDATVYDRPEQPVPIYIAGGGPGVTKYAGRAGDGYICTSGKGMDLYSQTLLPALREGLALSERSEGDIDRTIEIKLSFDEDPARALENTRFWAPLSLSPEQKASVHDPVEMARLADELPIEQVAKRWIVASDPAEVVAAVKSYTDAGFTHLVFHGPGHDQERFLTQFTQDVVPALRAL